MLSIPEQNCEISTSNLLSTIVRGGTIKVDSPLNVSSSHRTEYITAVDRYSHSQYTSVKRYKIRRRYPPKSLTAGTTIPPRARELDRKTTTAGCSIRIGLYETAFALKPSSCSVMWSRSSRPAVRSAA